MLSFGSRKEYSKCLFNQAEHLYLHLEYLKSRARILVQATIYRRLRISRDDHLDQSEVCDIS